jgi:hypothetical protein
MALSTKTSRQGTVKPRLDTLDVIIHIEFAYPTWLGRSTFKTASIKQSIGTRDFRHSLTAYAWRARGKIEGAI